MNDLTHVGVCKTQGESFCRKTMYASVCHYCKQPELVVSDVEVQGWTPKDYHSCVSCGVCGLRGPLGKTEEEAVDKWNEMAGLKKEDIDDFEWECTPLEKLDSSDLPF